MNGKYYSWQSHRYSVIIFFLNACCTVKFKIRPTVTFWVRTGETRKATDSLIMSSFQSLAPWIRSPIQRTAPNKRTSCLSCLNKDFSSFTICAPCTSEHITLSLGVQGSLPICNATKPASHGSCWSLCSRLLLL